MLPNLDRCLGRRDVPNPYNRQKIEANVMGRAKSNPTIAYSVTAELEHNGQALRDTMQTMLRALATTLLAAELSVAGLPIIARLAKKVFEHSQECALSESWRLAKTDGLFDDNMVRLMEDGTIMLDTTRTVPSLVQNELPKELLETKVVLVLGLTLEVLESNQHLFSYFMPCFGYGETETESINCGIAGMVLLSGLEESLRNKSTSVYCLSPAVCDVEFESDEWDKTYNSLSTANKALRNSILARSDTWPTTQHPLSVFSTSDCVRHDPRVPASHLSSDSVQPSAADIASAMETSGIKSPVQWMKVISLIKSRLESESKEQRKCFVAQKGSPRQYMVPASLHAWFSQSGYIREPCVLGYRRCGTSICYAPVHMVVLFTRPLPRLTGLRVDSHYKAHHAEENKQVDRKGIESRCAQYNVYDGQLTNYPQPSWPCLALNFLPAPEPVFMCVLCDAEDEEYFSATVDTCICHYDKKHSNSSIPNGKAWQTVLAQSFTPLYYTHHVWFRVLPKADALERNVPDPVFMNTSPADILKTYVENWTPAPIATLPIDSLKNVAPYLYYTGWAKHLEGRDPVLLRSLVAKPQPKDPLHRFYQNVYQLLMESQLV
ncbi:hypothetical protein RhiLY_12086 [Ceratobasidium sp. AG-Ba]|nr:hypothetical protein RhiLY_12086 [Ceratobasidium sp. AG-Ba]